MQTHPLTGILNKWRNDIAQASFSRTRDIGTAFETLCIHFLTHDSLQATQLENVRRFADWAKERGIDPSDTGVDLVADLRHRAGHAAIQCKLRTTGKSVSKAEINSFLSASSRTEFSHRIIIDTSAQSWSATAEATLRHQTVPVQRIGLHDLKASSIDWSRYLSAKREITKSVPKTPAPHQKTAIDNALRDLQSPDTRGKIFMACGTGKTLVGLRIAEQLPGTGGRVLVLVPSLALLSQTLSAWTLDATLPLRAFAVCSDSQTGRPRHSKTDTTDIDVLDLSYPATTNATTLAKHAVPPANNALTVLFATYHSSEVLEKAQAEHGLPSFDLAIADEAHRTAGALIPGEDPSPFVRIHDNARIRCDRRLYMTATPKVYAESARARAGKLAATLCSMDDEHRYGPTIYQLGFGEAVGNGILSDYRVIVLTIPESLAARVTLNAFQEGKTLTLDEQGKIIGCLRALSKADKDQFPGDADIPMRRAIAFCNFIESSRNVASAISEVTREFRDVVPTFTSESVQAQHVDGSFNATRRAEALDLLSTVPDGHCHILTNARCLTEGVDIPSLDAILFMHPRKSQIEVVQAVGRVMRKPPQGTKQLGYVVLPVVIPSGTSPEHYLDDNDRWKSVWQMLNAIRSHDERFDAMINRLEHGDPGQHISIITLADWQPPSADAPSDVPAPNPDTPPTPPLPQLDLFHGLPEAIRTRIVEKCGNRRYWEDWAGDVARIARVHIERITSLVQAGDAEREVFHEFLAELRDDLNPDISDADAIEMLAQHMVTRPVFDALFGTTDFSRHNSVAQGMQTVIDVLKPENFESELESLQGFYDSVRRRVQHASGPGARQKILVELYDKFFRNAFPMLTQRLGIVYTPVEVVDFIIRSVQDVLQDEFDTSLGAPDVHILDPFTGTGTFITRLIQSGLLSKQEILDKFGGNGHPPQIHANDIVLLAYYIASANIETAFQDATGSEYRPFDGICLADTFQLNEGENLLEAIFPRNSARQMRQKDLDIRVIIGNPPWSRGQKSEDDNAANRPYSSLDTRIRNTYAKHSTAKLKNPLYDSYIRAIRWASDRIGNQGIIGFVTGSAWIERSFADGLRKCLADEILKPLHFPSSRRRQKSHAVRRHIGRRQHLRPRQHDRRGHIHSRQEPPCNRPRQNPVPRHRRQPRPRHQAQPYRRPSKHPHHRFRKEMDHRSPRQ